MTAPQPLTPEQVAQRLASLAGGGWEVAGAQIQRTFTFKDFVQAMAFVEKVAAYAERVQHHPDILIRYNRVTLSVNTHDAAPGGALTEKDLALAAEANGMG